MKKVGVADNLFSVSSAKPQGLGPEVTRTTSPSIEVEGETEAEISAKKEGFDRLGDLHLSEGFCRFLHRSTATTIAMMRRTRQAESIETINTVDALLISFNKPIPEIRWFNR